MSLIKCVPEAVFCDILSDWCGLVELTKVDSAMCSRAERPFLIQLYSRNRFSVAELNCDKTSYLSWCDYKGLKYTKIKVNNFAHLPKISTTSIQFITCDAMTFSSDKSHLINFINSCAKISGLSVGGHLYSPDLMKVKTDIWANLTTFVGRTYDFSHNFVSFMAQHCTQLISLTLESCSDNNEGQLLEILKKNQNLKEISINQNIRFYFSDAILPILSQLNQLAVLDLYGIDGIHIRSLIDFIATASLKLKKIRLASWKINGFTYSFGWDKDLRKVASSLDILLSSMHHTYSGFMNTDDFIYMFERLTTLDHISLLGSNMNKYVTNEVLMLIARTNSRIYRLVVDKVCQGDVDMVAVKAIFENRGQYISIEIW